MPGRREHVVGGLAVPDEEQFHALIVPAASSVPPRPGSVPRCRGRHRRASGVDLDLCNARLEMTVGVVLGVMLISEQQARLFPPGPERDVNELPDGVVRGDAIGDSV